MASTLELKPWKKVCLASQQFFRATPAELGFLEAPTVAQINALPERRAGGRLSGKLALDLDPRRFATGNGDELLLFSGRPNRMGSQKVLNIHRACRGCTTFTELEHEQTKVIWLYQPIVFCSPISRALKPSRA